MGDFIGYTYMCSVSHCYEMPFTLQIKQYGYYCTYGMASVTHFTVSVPVGISMGISLDG